MDLQKKETGSRLLLLLLIGAGAVLCPFMLVDALVPGLGYFLSEKYLVVPSLLFLGAAVSGRLSVTGRRVLLLAVLSALWFAAVQMHHHLNHMDISPFGLFAVVYLLAFPYAVVAQENRNNAGLKWIGRIYLAFSGLMIVFAAMLLLDAVPEALASGLKWDGARVNLLWHPNGVGCLFMLAIGFGLYFFVRSKTRLQRGILAVLMVLQFCVLSLTNSRTAILLTCALIGGTVFFWIWRGGWKRFLAGAAAAAVGMAVLFCAYNLLFDWNTRVQTDKLVQKMQAAEAAPASPEPTAPQSQTLYVDPETGEAKIIAQSGQGELLSDMKGLNGRNTIWKSAFTAMGENPAIRIWGTQYVALEISNRNPFPVGHAHNSWVQTMMLLGIPGLLMALVYTVIAVWNLWILLWRPEEALDKKIIALMVVCLLGAGVLEIYLFSGDMTTVFANFVFFLCTGYLIQWNRKDSITE